MSTEQKVDGLTPAVESENVCYPKTELEPYGSEKDGGPASDATLRDYFAGQALQGLLADAWMKTDSSGMQGFAYEAYNWADAMLKARARSEVPHE